MQNGHVLLSKDKHYYSVPYQYIRKKVKIMYTSDKVEIYHKYNRIAIHKRNMQTIYLYNCKRTSGNHSSVYYRMDTADVLSTGQPPSMKCKEYILPIFWKESNIRSRLIKAVWVYCPMQRKLEMKGLINACKRALDYDTYNYKIIQKILEKGLDKLIEDDKPDARSS